MVRVAGLKRRMAAGASPPDCQRNGVSRGARTSGGRGRAHCAVSSVSLPDNEVLPRWPRQDIALLRTYDARRPSAEGRLDACSPGRGLPGADPARRRPGAPVPLHLQPVATSRSSAQDPATARPRFAGRGPARCPASGAGRPRQRVLRAAGGGHRRAPATALPGMEVVARLSRSGSRATPTSRWTRTRPSDLLRRSSGALAAPVRPPVRLEVETRMPADVARPAAGASWTCSRGRRFRVPGLLDLRPGSTHADSERPG